jgi:hypothetical protein
MQAQIMFTKTLHTQIHGPHVHTAQGNDAVRRWWPHAGGTAAPAKPLHSTLALWMKISLAARDSGNGPVYRAVCEQTALSSVTDTVHPVASQWAQLQSNATFMTELRGLQKWYLDKPIYQMRHDIPEMDPWCFFGADGGWMTDCALTHMHRSYTSHTKIYEGYVAALLQPVEMIKSRSVRRRVYKLRAKPANVTYEGRFFLHRNFLHAYDDLLCDASGFWALDRKLLWNYSALMETGEAFCWKLRRLGLRFETLRLAGEGGLGHMESIEVRGLEAAAMGRKNPWSLGHPRGATFGVLQHEATKCALSDVACDMSFCNSLGCLDANRVVHYGPECQVGVGEPPFALPAGVAPLLSATSSRVL